MTREEAKRTVASLRTFLKRDGAFQVETPEEALSLDVALGQAEDAFRSDSDVRREERERCARRVDDVVRALAQREATNRHTGNTMEAAIDMAAQAAVRDAAAAIRVLEDER